MNSIKMGFLGGLMGTFVAGSMLLMNNALNSFPQLHVAHAMAAILGSPDNVMVGVAAIMVIGIVVFGALFAVIAPRLPMRSYLVKGLAFAGASWLLMMVVFMPLDGAGFFGLKGGPIVPEATLVLNLAYWIMLGVTYSWLINTAGAPQRIQS